MVVVVGMGGLCYQPPLLHPHVGPWPGHGDGVLCPRGNRRRRLLIGCRSRSLSAVLRSPSSWSEQRWSQTQRLSINTKMDDDLFQLRQLPWVDCSLPTNAFCFYLADLRRRQTSCSADASLSVSFMFVWVARRTSFIPIIHYKHHHHLGYLAGYITEKCSSNKESERKKNNRERSMFSHASLFTMVAML